MKQIVASFCLCSCGTVTADLISPLPESGPLPPPTAGDAGPDTDPAPDRDAAPPLARRAFSAPQLIPGLAVPGAHSDDPTLPRSQLELYFSSNRPPSESYDIWRVARGSVGDAWGPATRVLELSGQASERTPAIADDGLTIWFSSSRSAPAGFDGSFNVWRSERSQLSEAWGAPVLEVGLSSASSDLAGHVAEGGLFAIVSRAEVAGNGDLFGFSRETPNEAWGPPLPLAELNTGTTDEGTVRQNGLLVVFSSAGGASRDLYEASRASLEDPFGSPEALTELNSTSLDTDPWVSEDLTTLIFSSDRDGLQQFYEAKRLPAHSK